MGTPEAALDEIRSWISKATPDFNPAATSSFDTTAGYELRDFTASPGRLLAKLRVNPRSQNDYGTMHGGLYTALVDIVGFAALTTLKANDGVSLQVSCDYYSPMPGGEDVEIDAQVVRMGRRVATVRVDFRRVASGAIVASGKLIAVLTSSASTGKEVGDISADVLPLEDVIHLPSKL
eukprot:jgi/Botrbrau1/18341/Bobra.0179s0068.1